MVRCSDCPAEYHVSCAWKAGHKFGFELQPVGITVFPFRDSKLDFFFLPVSVQVKASRRDVTTVVEFKDAAGCMVPVVTCKGHPAHRRESYDICEMNDYGEVIHLPFCIPPTPTLTLDFFCIDRNASILQELQTSTYDRYSSLASQSQTTRPNTQC